MREERASTPRAGPRPDFRAYGAQGRLSTSGNRVSRPGPRPRAGTGWLQAPQRSQHHHLSKGLDNKRRAGAEKWGRGYSKYSKSFLRRGCVLLSPASSFCEFLEVTPELAPDAPKALTTHTAAEAFIHTSALRSRYTRRHAQRLPSSFQTARVTVQIEGNAAVPLRFPGRAGVPTGSSPLSLTPSLHSPRAGQSRLGVAINSSEQPGVTPATKTAGMARGEGGWRGGLSEPETLSRARTHGQASSSQSLSPSHDGGRVSKN